MARDAVTVRVDNLREVQLAIRKAKDKDIRAAMKQANRDAADVVVPEAKSEAPKASGALEASIGAKITNEKAEIKAGTAARVPYAGPIHFGWPKRNIGPHKFLFHAVGVKGAQIRDAFEKAIDDIVEALNRVTR